MKRDIVVTINGTQDPIVRHFVLESDEELAQFLLHLDKDSYYVASIDYVAGKLERTPTDVFKKSGNLEMGA